MMVTPNVMIAPNVMMLTPNVMMLTPNVMIALNVMMVTPNVMMMTPNVMTVTASSCEGCDWHATGALSISHHPHIFTHQWALHG